MKWRHLLLVVSILFLAAAETFAQGCPPPTNIPVGSCAPKTGTPVSFAGDTGTMRTRKSIYTLTPAEITELKLAFQRLRALPSTDPRAWMAQAKVHCWYCAGDNSTVPDVHTTWAFLPWHRNYLYVLEKILGQLVNNPNFALPYWDWNTADTPTCTGHLKVPPPYLGGTTATNALVDCYRGSTIATATMSAASVGPARVNTILNNANTFSLFFGTASSSSALWVGPHGYVHLFVGNPTNLTIARQDMGVLETASRDPLFWAHHANIDRLWDVWISKLGTPAYPADFLAQSWTFWNQSSPSQLVRLTARDAANRSSRLRYQYAPPCGATTTAEEPEEEMVSLTAQPQTFQTEAKAPARKYTIGEATGTHVVINLEEVTVPADQSAILRVYVNRPTVTAATADAEDVDTGLVEELFIVPSRTPGTGHGEHQHSINLKIVLPPDIAAQVEAAQGRVAVTIVPVGSTASGALAAEPEDVDVKMKKPYISVE